MKAGDFTAFDLPANGLSHQAMAGGVKLPKRDKYPYKQFIMLAIY